MLGGSVPPIVTRTIVYFTTPLPLGYADTASLYLEAAHFGIDPASVNACSVPLATTFFGSRDGPPGVGASGRDSQLIGDHVGLGGTSGRVQHPVRGQPQLLPGDHQVAPHAPRDVCVDECPSCQRRAGRSQALSLTRITSPCGAPRRTGAVVGGPAPDRWGMVSLRGFEGLADVRLRLALPPPQNCAPSTRTPAATSTV